MEHHSGLLVLIHVGQLPISFCRFADLDSFCVFFLAEHDTLFFGPYPRQKAPKWATVTTVKFPKVA